MLIKASDKNCTTLKTKIERMREKNAPAAGSHKNVELFRCGARGQNDSKTRQWYEITIALRRTLCSRLHYDHRQGRQKLHTH